MHSLAAEGIKVNATRSSRSTRRFWRPGWSQLRQHLRRRIATRRRSGDGDSERAPVAGPLGYDSRIIAGSIRSVMDIQVAAVAGADIITIPPQLLSKMVDHRYTRETCISSSPMPATP